MKKGQYLILVLNGLFFILDRFLKFFSAKSSFFSSDKLIGFSFFQNYGVAFGVPLPNKITIIFTIIILAIIGYVLIKEHSNKTLFLSLTLIFTGAFSNLIDRLYYGHVIDYFTFFTSVINISDILIVSGFGLYLYNQFKARKKQNPGL